ncbi:ATP-dependent DNA helicase [Aphelenchoides besseyi]|nr:ATP-dependent DNA helicase [Aphelenchoides besseyi]
MAAERLKLESELEAIQSQINVLKQRKNEIHRKLEELDHRDAQQSAARNQIDWENAEFPWSTEIATTLHDVFGLTSFRELQRSVINLVLSAQDVILVMSTGAGKSLCFQLPAVLRSKPGKLFSYTISIGLSKPLLALVEDQIIQLRSRGIEAEALNQSTSREDVTRIQNEMCNPNSSLRLVYVTPEKLAKSKRFMNKLEKCYSSELLKLIAVDEVHCCSSWGHDFRPDYKFLSILKRQFPTVPILGLTATATNSLIQDVQKILQIQYCTVLRASFNRPNLFYEVRVKPEKNEKLMEQIAILIKTEFVKQTGIIYCLSKKECEELTSYLQANDIVCGFYHADLTAENRSSIHNKWATGRIQCIVATLAFGMGVDKPNVRFVIHHSIPKSIENYYQESGRAGRDGNPARCIAFYRLADVFRLSTLNYAERTREYTMLEYCTQSYRCRREMIAQSFGEEYEASWCDKKCDVCVREQRESVEFDITDYANKVVEIIDSKLKTTDQGRVTGNKLCELLAKKCPEVTRELIELIIAHLIAINYLKEDLHFTPYSVVGYVVRGFVVPTPITMIIDASLLDSFWSASGPSKRPRK